MADRTVRFSNWFQIISNVAIIIGLGLVVYDLNQSKELAWAQMAESYASRRSDRGLAMMGENPQEALARASFHPADLNEQDAVILAAFYEDIAISWTVALRTSRIVGSDRGWRETVQFEAPRFFSSDPGRRWLESWAAGLPDSFGLEEVAKLALEAVQNGSANSLRSSYDLLLGKN